MRRTFIIIITIVFLCPTMICFAYTSLTARDIEISSDRIDRSSRYSSSIESALDEADINYGFQDISSDVSQNKLHSLRNDEIKNFIEIEDLKSKEINFGSYYVKGYVSKVYTCPPCVEGAVCKMCMQDNVVISKHKKFLDKYDLTKEDLIVFVEDIEEFQLGKQYIMLVQVLNVKTTIQGINNIKLIYYEEITSRR